MVLLLRYRRLFHKAVFQRVRVAVIYRVALREPGEDLPYFSETLFLRMITAAVIRTAAAAMIKMSFFFCAALSLVLRRSCFIMVPLSCMGL